jgi:hypothetical protein
MGRPFYLKGKLPVAVADSRRGWPAFSGPQTGPN